MVNTSRGSGGDTTIKSDFVFECQPDCSVFVRPAGPPTFDDHLPTITYSPASLEFVVEFKLSASADPFVVPKKRTGEETTRSESPLMNTTVTTRAVVGQITAYATQILSSQYRTHAFTVLICHNLARLIRWDRAGAIVTEPIYYNDDSYLHDFLTRYNDALPNIRGHDSTVTPISNSIRPDLFQRAQSVVHELAKEDYLLLLAIPGPDSDGRPTSRSFAVSQPRVEPEIPTGRWTRTSIAYDVERNQRVFLKDSWRALIDDIEPEGVVYNLLLKGNVPNVPVCSVASDIGGRLHVTYTDRFVEKYLEYKPPHFTAHRHYRLVLDTIGRKLEEFPCTRVMVEAVRAAVHGKCRWLIYSASLTHIAAHRRAWSIGILHRDLSPGNIMIVENEEVNIKHGLLIDWDLCKVFKRSGSQDGLAPPARRYACTVSSTFCVQYFPSPDILLPGNMAVYGSGAH